MILKRIHLHLSLTWPFFFFLISNVYSKSIRTTYISKNQFDTMDFSLVMIFDINDNVYRKSCKRQYKIVARLFLLTFTYQKHVGFVNISQTFKKMFDWRCCMPGTQHRHPYSPKSIFTALDLLLTLSCNVIWKKGFYKINQGPCL
jgi:hypothetical protein